MLLKRNWIGEDLLLITPINTISPVKQSDNNSNNVTDLLRTGLCSRLWGEELIWGIMTSPRCSN